MKQKVKNQPVYLGFASQKGGVGKSSLAEILASILYYEKGISLLVVDCDGTQESFFKLRQRERRVIEGSETISDRKSNFFTKFGKHAYPIIRSTPKNVIKYVNEYIRTHDIKVNLVIFDFPGHASTEDLLQLSIDMDYIITPIEADPQSLAMPGPSGTWESDLAMPVSVTCSYYGTKSTVAPVPSLWTITHNMQRKRTSVYLMPAYTIP